MATVRIWDLEKREPAWTLFGQEQGHKDAILALALRAQWTFCLCVSRARYDPENVGSQYRQMPENLSGHRKDVHAIAVYARWPFCSLRKP